MIKAWAKPIQTALRRRSNGAVVNASAAWKAISYEYSVGVRKGRTQIVLSNNDLDRLHKALAVYLCNDNPVLVNLDADRMTLALETPQEKQSPSHAFCLVRVAPTDGYVTVLDITTQEPQRLRVLAGTVLSVRLDQLMLEADNYQHIIIIENGAAIEWWWNIVPLLPTDLRTNTLFVYRGHGNEQKRLLKTLAKLSSHSTRFYFFGDYDPSGINIAVTSIMQRLPNKTFSIIAPADQSALTERMNKYDVFLKQLRDLKRVRKRTDLSASTLDLLSHLERKQLAITQETLMAQGVPLAVYSQSIYP